MSLVIRDKAISEIPVALQPYIAARLTDPISKIGNFDLENRVKDILLRAHFEMGIHVPSDRVISSLREILTKDLRAKRYATVGIQEIELFISNGIRGEYGTFKSQLSAVNIQNIHYWIKSGLESKQRELAMKAYIEKIDKIERSNKPTHYTPEQWIEVCKTTFKNYKEREGDVKTLWVNASAASIYDIINSKLGTEYKHPKGIIRSLVTDQEIRKDLASLAQAEYTGFKRDLKKMGYLKDKKEEDEFDKGTGYSNILKKHYLIHFFDSLIEQGKGLEM